MIRKPAIFHQGSRVADGWKVRPCRTGRARGSLLKNSDHTTVSIITPAFNAERFITETIGSVQAQTHTDWEMLIVDDVSRDRTREIVGELAATDPRIHLTAQQRNSGPAGARNTALEQARGRYIAFLDSDDLWLPDKLTRQVAFMRERDCAFSYTSYGVINENGNPIGRVAAPPSVDYRALLKNTIIGCLTVMLDREKTGPLQMLQLPQHEDLTLWYSVLKRGIIAYGIPDELAHYRIVGDSASRNKVRSALHMWKVYRQVEKLNLLDSLWCYGHYAWHAYRKNRVG